MTREADKPVLLVAIPMGAGALPQLSARFELLYAPDADSTAQAVRDHGARIDAVLTNGSVGLAAEAIDAMPRLSLVCALGVGHENIPLAPLRTRGIVLANGAGTNADCVADHALALLLASLRDLPRMDRDCRAGVWRDALALRPQLAHRKVGLFGLGDVGRKIARRCEGFDVELGYHTRHARPDVAWRHFAELTALAQWCDVLIVAVPGGASTRHRVDATVLDAVGPQGVLVNIARGSVVDTAALATALRSGRLGAAALDVYESEPAPPAALLDLPNVLLTPHVAGASPEAKDATLANFLVNAERHFRGEPVLTPV